VADWAPATPPVVLLGIDTPIGLTILRELGERGVAVYGIARSPEGIGLRSRYLRRGWIAPAGEAETLALIREIAAENGARFLMTISERDILWLNRERAALGDLRPLIPDAARMARVLDKAMACDAARAVGLEVPETWQLEGDHDVERVAAAARYPVILKWGDPVAMSPRLRAAGLTLMKAEYCYDAGELRRALGRYAPIGRFPLVQGFCPGLGLGHMVFMHRGEPVLRFQHRRLREWPPEGGTSTAAISVPLDEHAELFARSVALLRRLEWEGAAMVEYRHDPGTGRSAFMEVNGRFWGSQPLAYHAGAPFGWYTYSVLGLGRVPAPASYRGGLRCRFVIPDTRRLFTVLFDPGAVQNRHLRLSRGRELVDYVVDFLRPGARYFVFRWRDPLPALADLAGVLRKAVRGLLGRLLGVFSRGARRSAPRSATPSGPRGT
jgi:predicted ATP-grasp superfamily ATP-dependent carboligase